MASTIPPPLFLGTALAAIVIAAAAANPAATAQPAAKAPASKARVSYRMTVETATFGPEPNSPPDAQTTIQRRLGLELASPRRPDDRPSATHLPPAGLGIAEPISLHAPFVGMPVPVPPPSPSRPGDGLVRIYWGCGEHVRPGQPMTVRASDAFPSRAPAALAAMPFARPDGDPDAATVGVWSSGQRVEFPEGASLAGAHRVSGNYLPDIRFTLPRGQNFLAPVTLIRNEPAPSGAVPLSWRPIAGARGWFLRVGRRDPDGAITWWTSSEQPFPKMWEMDYLAASDIAPLLRTGILRPPAQTQCTVPAEIVREPGSTLINVFAFGPDANFSDTAGPWTVTLRTRSGYMGRLGR